MVDIYFVSMGIPSGKHTFKLLNMAIEIVELPIENGGSFQFVFVCLPEGSISIWVNYNDLTATSLESWLVREIIPKWPNNSG